MGTASRSACCATRRRVRVGAHRCPCMHDPLRTGANLRCTDLEVSAQQDRGLIKRESNRPRPAQLRERMARTRSCGVDMTSRHGPVSFAPGQDVARMVVVSLLLLHQCNQFYGLGSTVGSSTHEPE